MSIVPVDADFRYWADKFGVKVGPRESARAVLASAELPAGLAELVEGFR